MDFKAGLLPNPPPKSILILFSSFLDRCLYFFSRHWLLFDLAMNREIETDGTIRFVQINVRYWINPINTRANTPMTYEDKCSCQKGKMQLLCFVTWERILHSLEDASFSIVLSFEDASLDAVGMLQY